MARIAKLTPEQRKASYERQLANDRARHASNIQTRLKAQYEALDPMVAICACGKYYNTTSFGGNRPPRKLCTRCPLRPTTRIRKGRRLMKDGTIKEYSYIVANHTRRKHNGTR